MDPLNLSPTMILSSAIYSITWRLFGDFSLPMRMVVVRNAAITVLKILTISSTLSDAKAIFEAMFQFQRS